MRQVLSKSELADLLGLSERHVDRLAASGVLPRVKDGFPLSAVTSYIKSLRAGEPLLAERRKLIAARRKLIDIELAEKRGELVRIEDVEKCWQETLGMLRARLLVLPPTAAPLVAGGHSVSEVQGVLQRLVNEALTELSRGADAAAAGRK